MKNCATCSMPLEKIEDFALGNPEAEFCRFCVNEDGSVKSCEEIFEGGASFFVQATGSDRPLAERLTRKNMKGLPYWQGHECAILVGDVATDEEFAAIMSKL
ncbi:MAG: zinc ribbon domain-containing protein [Patescibacteria group bacterium]